MKVLLDSNLYRQILLPDCFGGKNNNINNYSNFLFIKEKIKDETITAFLSETTFTIETIERQDRYKFFGEIKKPNSKYKNYDIPQCPTRKRCLEEAKKLEIKIIKMPRIGMPQIEKNDIDNSFFLDETGNEALFDEHHEKKCKLAKIIEGKGFGFYKIKEFCKNNNPDMYWYKSLDEKYTDVKYKEIVADCFAEWSDGDIVSICYGHDIDYICTNDHAKKAKQNSIFSTKNRQWLKDDYNVNCVSVEELVKILNNSCNK